MFQWLEQWKKNLKLKQLTGLARKTTPNLSMSYLKKRNQKTFTQKFMPQKKPFASERKDQKIERKSCGIWWKSQIGWLLNHTLLTLTKESVSLTASCSLSSLHGRRQKGKEKPRVGIWFFPFAGYSLSDITRHSAPLPGLIHDKITTGEFK